MTDTDSQPNPSEPEDLERRVRSRLGSTLEGVGELQEILGIGGMATVYEARTPSAESVAVKLMHEHLSDKGSLRRRFIREAKILDQVTHPNAVTVFDRGDATTGEAYFVMELLDGWEVETVWKNKDQAFPVDEALEIAVQGLDCLHAYHRADVLHRDLKPSNLFLTRDGTVKLIDFGVAQFRDQTTEKTRAGTALGTPAYMAPEQAMGKVELLDARTDVYGFGAVLFTLLADRRVHEAETNDETLVMAATQPADSLARHAADVPTEVVRIVDRALSWDPEDRYESAERMQSDVRSLLDEAAGELEREATSPAEELDGTEQALEREAADVVVDVDPDAIEGMKILFERLEQALEAARIYEWGHDKTNQSFDHAYSAFRETIDRERGEVFWMVRPHSFEVDDELLWNPEDSFELVPYHLFVDGFRRIQLRSSMTLEGFVAFARWLTLDPYNELPQEDDLATALWDLELEHVDAKVVTAPTMLDPDRDDLLLEEEADDLLEEAESMMEDGAGKRLLVAMRTGAYAEAEAMMEGSESGGLATGSLGQDFTVADRGLVDSSRIEQLSDAIDRENQEWEWRIERIFGDVWGGAVDLDADAAFAETARELVSLYLESDRLEPLLRILLRSYRQLDDPEKRQFYVQYVLDDETVRAISEALRETIPAEPDDPSDPPTELDLYSQILKLIPADRFDALLGEFQADHAVVRRAISRYLHRHASGRERAMAATFSELDADGRSMLLDVVARAGTHDAFEVLTDELETDEPDIRRRALALLHQHFDLESGRFDLSDSMAGLLDDFREPIRLAALRLARKIRANPLVPKVADRALGRDFDSLSTDERREILQTLAVLSRSKAQEVACELAEHHGVMPGEDRHRTRVLALRILGEIGEDERALKAAETGMGGWWWNSDDVKDAAETAYKQIERRMDADS